VKRWYNTMPEVVLSDVRLLERLMVMEWTSLNPGRLDESMRGPMCGGTAAPHRSARCIQVLLNADTVGYSAV
jgi:hypothetical protein